MGHRHLCLPSGGGAAPVDQQCGRWLEAGATDPDVADTASWLTWAAVFYWADPLCGNPAHRHRAGCALDYHLEHPWRL